MSHKAVRAVVFLGICSISVFCLAAEKKFQIYQLEGMLHSFSSLQGGGGEDATTILVAMHRATRQTKIPERQEYQTMTFLGEKSWATGELNSIRKVCDYLCGEEAGSEECHYQLLYSLTEAKDIGKPLAAVPGHVKIDDYVAIKPAAPQGQITNPGETKYKKQIWGDNTLSFSILWDETKKQMTLNSRNGGKVYPTRDQNCRFSQVDRFTTANCDSFSVLLDSSGPLLVSYPDYNRALIKLHAKFSVDGQIFYLLQMGLKASDVFGVLTEQPGGWRFMSNPVNFALLC